LPIRRLNVTFEILGISGKGYDFKWVKITIYIDPLDYSRQIRLLIKAIFEPIEDSLSNPVYIYLQSNRKIKIKDKEIHDISKKIGDPTYSERIGADELVEKTIPLKIKYPVSHVAGKDNRIVIKVVPEKEMNKLQARLKKKQKESQDVSKDKFGFMIDTVIQNEGIEKEPLWKRLLGWSQFAWRFHFKVWSMTEDLEPIEPISSKTTFVNSTGGVQMFLVIPEGLIKSPGQIVSHPGEGAMHIMTVRDKNTFLISGETENMEEKKKWEKRVREWVEEKAMAIAWEHGQTASMSRESIVEHRQAYPRVWAVLTFVTLSFILGMNIFPKARTIYPQIMFLIYMAPFLFILAYFIMNMYNFSFYELRRKTTAKFLMEFLVISMLSSLIMIFISVFVIKPFIKNILDVESLTVFPAIIIFATSVLSIIKENREIKKGNIRIRESEMIPYLFLRFLSQIIAVSITVYISTRIFSFDIDAILLFAYVYAMLVGLPASGSLIREVSVPDLRYDTK